MRLFYALQEFESRLFFSIFRQGERVLVRSVAQAISKSADGYLFVLVPCLMLGLSSKDQSLLFVKLVALALFLERILYWSIKNSMRRKRPQESLDGFHSIIVAADKFSFPSGHTSGAFLLATALYLVYPGAAVIMFGWAIAVGVSRVLLGVHYPGDIVAGAAMGFTTAWYIFPKLAG